MFKNQLETAFRNLLKYTAYFIPFYVLTVFILSPDVSLSQEVKEVDKTVPLKLDGRVLIDTFKGSVNVTTWDKSEVHIHARIEPGGPSRREQEWVHDTEIQILHSGNSVRIKTDYDKLRGRKSFFGDSGSNPFVHYTIQMPYSANLDIEDHKSELNIIDHRSELRIDTHKGVVDVKNQKGSVILETHKGDVRVEFVEFTNDSRFETHKGDIEIVLPKDSKFDLEGDLGSRAHFDSDFEIKIDRSKFRDRGKQEDEFYIAINGGGPLLRLSTYKGYFRLKKH
ncbi:MAG: DUF4097 family beta strand repeat-containing protein [bacterium]